MQHRREYFNASNGRFDQLDIVRNAKNKTASNVTLNVKYNYLN